MTFRAIAQQIGELVEQKNAAYGNSFAKTGEFLGLLYPNGILPEQYDDALLITRIFDKLQRIATDCDALGESPYRDIAGYGILGASLHEVKQGKENDATSVPAARMQQSGQTSQNEVLQRGVRARRLPRGASQSDMRTMRKETQTRKTTKTEK